MSPTGTLNQASRLTMEQSSSLLAASSHQRCASITAAVSASAARGWRSTQSARTASAFSGWFFHSSPVIAAVKPARWLTSCAFHGSPTQNASMAPFLSSPPSPAAGSPWSCTSLSGVIPAAASQ